MACCSGSPRMERHVRVDVVFIHPSPFTFIFCLDGRCIPCRTQSIRHLCRCCHRVGRSRDVSRGNIFLNDPWNIYSNSPLFVFIHVSECADAPPRQSYEHHNIVVVVVIIIIINCANRECCIGHNIYLCMDHHSLRNFLSHVSLHTSAAVSKHLVPCRA